MWANFHTHCEYCDGKGVFQDYLEAAQRERVGVLGFSSHAPVPFESPWCMKGQRLEHYLSDINDLRQRNTPVEIYSGLEVDFIPGKIGPADFQNKLDYTIGSIHFIDSFPNGSPWEIDGSHQVFLDGLETIFNNDIKEALKRYYGLTRQMVNESKPDIIGHLDKIKIQNHHPSQFSEADKWYQEEITQTLDLIADAGCIVEINTRGVYQKKSVTTYPSPWILEMIRKRNIPITISSDAHHPKDLTNQFIETAHLLFTLGFRKISILKDGKWNAANLTPNGYNW